MVTAYSAHFRPQTVVEPEGDGEEEEESGEEEGTSDEDSSDEESKRTRFQEKKPPAPSILSPEPQVTPWSFKGFFFKGRQQLNLSSDKEQVTSASSNNNIQYLIVVYSIGYSCKI